MSLLDYAGPDSKRVSERKEKPVNITMPPWNPNPVEFGVYFKREVEMCIALIETGTYVEKFSLFSAEVVKAARRKKEKRVRF